MPAGALEPKPPEAPLSLQPGTLYFPHSRKNRLFDGPLSLGLRDSELTAWPNMCSSYLKHGRTLPVVQGLRPVKPNAGVWVQSLVGEQRSHGCTVQPKNNGNKIKCSFLRLAKESQGSTPGKATA